MKLTRAKMEQLCDDLFERTIVPREELPATPDVSADKSTNWCWSAA
jgi:molecular chaperone DnaK (HSP70)